MHTLTILHTVQPYTSPATYLSSYVVFALLSKCPLGWLRRGLVEEQFRLLDGFFNSQLRNAKARDHQDLVDLREKVREAPAWVADSQPIQITLPHYTNHLLVVQLVPPRLPSPATHPHALLADRPSHTVCVCLCVCVRRVCECVCLSGAF